MADGTKLDTIFYELEAKSDQFDAQMERARRTLRAFSSEKPPAVALDVDASKVTPAVTRAKEQVKDLPGTDGRPVLLRFDANIKALEDQLAAAKARATELGATRQGKPLQAKLDADIAAFEAKLTRARATARTLAQQPASIKLDANTSALDATLKRLTVDLDRFGSTVDQRLNVGPVLEEAGDSAKTFGDEFQVAGRSVTGMAEEVTRALQSPAAAAAVVATAVVGISAAATRVAGEFDTAFRRVEAALPTDTDAAGLASLRQEVVDLSVVTPRTTQELTALAEAVGKMGEADPAEVGNNLRTITLVGDALSATDLSPLADQLDLLGDAFGLTAEEARQTFVQIAAMTKGKIQLEDLSSVLSKSATRMAALGISAAETAATMTVLVDAGINSRQITTGLVDLLDKAGTAERQAIDAALAGREQDAAALGIFAGTVNETNVQSKGLVGTLADLYEKLDGSRARFQAAGLSLNDYQIAAKAADAATSGAQTQVLSYAEALAKLGPAAEVNRTSAAALSQVLKNELAAQMIDLGNVFLPTVNRGLQLLVNLLSDTRRQAKQTASDLPAIREMLDGGRVGFASRRAQPTVAAINARPGFLDGFDVEQLRDLQGVFRALQKAGEGGEGLTAALSAVESRLQSLTGAAATVTATMPDTGLSLADVGAKALAAAEQIKSAREAASSLLLQFADVSPAERGAQAIAAWEARAREAKVPAQELAETAATLRSALDQALRTDLAEKTTRELADLVAALRDIEAQASGDALQVLEASYAKITEELLRQAAAAEAAATAADRVGDEDLARRARETAAGFRAQADAAGKQKAQLVEIERLARRAADARQTEADFAKAANASYTGQAKTVADLRRAENDRLTVITALNALIADPATDPKARVAAQNELNKLTGDQATAQEAVSVASSAAADATQALGLGIRASAQSALTLVQVLGEGNSELAAMLAGVLSVGDGIAGLGAAAKSAGGFGQLFSSGAGIASALGPIGAIAGGAFAVFGAISKSSEEAKRRAEELKLAAETFTANLAAFVRDLAEQDAGEFDRARTALAERITRLLADAAKAAGFDPKSYDGTQQSVASLQGLLDSVEAQIAALQEQVGNADQWDLPVLMAQMGQLTGFANRLRQAIEVAAEAEAALSERQRARLQLATEDLEVLRLEVTGQSEAAAAMRERLETERKIQQAIADFSGAEGYEAYVAALREVTELQLKAAAATRKLSGALRMLDDLETFFPELTGRNLSGLQATGARVWPEIFNTLFEGLDLSTRSGLQGARDRIRNLYTELAADGIDESERPLVDFLKRFFGEIGDAIDGLGDPILNAIEAFNVQAENAGFTAAQRFQGLGAFLKLNTAGLGDILGTSFQQDVLTGEGRASLEARIRQGISDIVADGQITDAERPLLDALQQLLGLVLQAIDDAAETASSARDRATQTRTTASQLDLALGDLEGADAFRNTLEKFTPAFAALFETFDLQALEGIEGARQGLRSIRADLDTLTDAELLAKYGMTREEIVAALLEVDAGLDGLASTLKTLAEQSVDFVTTLTNDWLDATGRGMDVQLAAVDQWVEDMLAEAERLGVITDAIRTMINEIADERRAEIRERFTPQVETPRELANRPSGGSGSPSGTAERVTVLDGETTAQRVSSISEITAQSLLGFFPSLLEEARGTRLAAEQIAAMCAVLVGGSLPALQVPSLPRGVGAGGFGGGAQVAIIVNVSSTVAALTPQQAGEDVARAILPFIDTALARAAGIEARIAGRALS